MLGWMLLCVCAVMLLTAGFALAEGDGSDALVPEIRGDLDGATDVSTDLGTIQVYFGHNVAAGAIFDANAKHFSMVDEDGKDVAITVFRKYYGDSSPDAQNPDTDGERRYIYVTVPTLTAGTRYTLTVSEGVVSEGNHYYGAASVTFTTAGTKPQQENSDEAQDEADDAQGDATPANEGATKKGDAKGEADATQGKSDGTQSSKASQGSSSTHGDEAASSKGEATKGADSEGKSASDVGVVGWGVDNQGSGGSGSGSRFFSDGSDTSQGAASDTAHASSSPGSSSSHTYAVVNASSTAQGVASPQERDSAESGSGGTLACLLVALAIVVTGAVTRRGMFRMKKRAASRIGA